MSVRKMLCGTLLTVLALTSVLAAAPRAAAEERVCRGTLGAITVDNLRVPQSAACTLNGTRVKGTITVQRDARLRATGIRVIGNVQAENHRLVVLGGSSIVGGSVQIDQGGLYRVANTRVEGSIQVVANRGQSRLYANTVNQDVQVFSHRDGVAIANNRVDGNLQCKENVPAPTGGGNIVQGNKEDQCKRL